MIYKNILSEKHLEVLKKLKSLPKGTYMAGGTALALQLGHRTSLDFDFCTKEHFETEIVLKSFQQDIPNIKIERVAKDTLILDADGIIVSLFYYPYELIRNLVSFEKINLASTEDVAAMKIVAVSMRGKRRDFIDVYYLLQKFSLEEIVKFTIEKYPSYQPMVILKGLIYFKDVEEEDFSRGIKVFDKDFSWEKVKKKIFEEVEKYQASIANI
ncbi:MAG: hypothetical protein UU16_C0029G0003 [Candidatus Woesebacteria bacterium GW2011_GWA2_40_7]|uniref:Nucleotidyl transferase AbiEii/AbiGii toxin family protein n=3 Tax=Candidatus Woeseibacteriota TaxID=1752722 RepID=A0A0G0LJW1_9BACT|nr:MAG: hypothetical protein UT17_C0003G0206 [Candidatus Woesebacteria bacterium GW2011_GWB1_39_10]KKR73148.1 MAG: hypothetical protein UU16_C0029G0003 [Candidatus Woesebacteria bacterium GW2011_GWA2_40_7]KKS91143.1 MAG: hypothetical protein UV66_C0001G0500 [Candidatus Woesebacteria bacterium GW2011_GWA1_43_12]